MGKPEFCVTFESKADDLVYWVFLKRFNGYFKEFYLLLNDMKITNPKKFANSQINLFFDLFLSEFNTVFLK